MHHTYQNKPAGLLEWPEALKIVLSSTIPLEGEVLPVDRAVGRVSMCDIVASQNVPPFTNSSMDGYAVRAQDVVGAASESPIPLRVIGEARAGKPFRGKLSGSQAVEIMTGAPMPEGADAVVPVELTRRVASDAVEILKEVRPGSAVRLAGADTRSGEIVVRAGETITAGIVGRLASCGIASIEVVRLPRVAIATSGDELVPPDDGHLATGKIFDSNSPMLVALFRSWGIEPVFLGCVTDSLEAIKNVLARAFEFDFLVMTGGVSVGKYDFVKQALTELGGETLFWRVNQQPGKPLFFGRSGKTLVFGMPGNPVACYFCSDLYLRSAIRKAVREAPPYIKLLRVEVGEDVSKADTRTAFRRARIRLERGRLCAYVIGPPDSHIISTVTSHDGYLIVPAVRALLHAGDPADFVLAVDNALAREMYDQFQNSNFRI